MVSARLSVMMFLQFFIWGAWYMTVGNYMAAVGMTEAIYLAYTVGPLGALVSPFFLGMVADRYFAAERLLGALNLLAGLAMLGAAGVEQGHTGTFIGFLLLHMLCFMPTLGLASSITFHHITHRERQFPVIRAFGTMGWVVAGGIVSGLLAADATVLPLYWSAGSALMMGFYSFTLPYTPPQNQEAPSLRALVGVDALRRLWSRPFAVFVCCSVLISIPLSAYSAYTPVYVAAAGMPRPGFIMSFGQMTEVVVMFLMPVLFLWLGFRRMYLIGLAAWALRYALFATAASPVTPWMILLGILLHGICFDFVYVSGQIFLDNLAGPRLRGQAQGFFVMIDMGLGPLVGAPAAGWLFNRYVEGVETAGTWADFWWVPAVFCSGVLLLFALLFPRQYPAENEPAPVG